MYSYQEGYSNEEKDIILHKGERSMPCIQCQFDHSQLSSLARDTLMELGYQVEQDKQQDCTLFVTGMPQDLIAMLEIIQAYGGNLMEQHDQPTPEQLYSISYNLSVPDHLSANNAQDFEASIDEEEELEPSSLTYERIQLPYPILAENARLDPFVGPSYYEFANMEDEIEGPEEIDLEH